MFGFVRTLVSILLGAIELILGFRLIFKFFSASTRAPFVAWLYGISAPLVAPFAGIIPSWKLGGFMVDFASLAALIVYTLIGHFILEIFSYTSSAGSRLHAA